MAHAAVAPVPQSSQPSFSEPSARNEAHSSAISWAAVFGGAAAGAATSLILFALGTGIGLSSISPWSNSGATANAVGKGAIVWLILTQIIASAIGGYLAGRLRTKWVHTHTDEVYFRDTAHGFLVWAVAMVITAGFLASATSSMVGGAAQLAATASSDADPNAYYVDSLFRSGTPGSGTIDDSLRTEVGAIFANGLRQQDVPSAGKTYLAQTVADKHGMNQTEAEQRVSETITQAKQAADTARKAVAHLSYWSFFALLVGAFCASFAATIGGKQRDHVVAI